MTSDKKLIVEYSGWIEVHPDTMFDRIGDEGDSITAAEYMELPEDERDNYILQSFGEACNEATDGDLDTNIIVEDDN